MRLGAKMVPFAGWLMPVQYTSIVEEHHEVGHGSDLPGGKRDACAAVLKNRSASFGGVAIQGPRVVELLQALFGKDTEPPPRNHIVDLAFDETTVSVARTGYTGEDGI